MNCGTLEKGPQIRQIPKKKRFKKNLSGIDAKSSSYSVTHITNKLR